MRMPRATAPSGDSAADGGSGADSGEGAAAGNDDKDSKDNKDSKDSKDSKDDKGSKDSKDSKDDKGSKDSKDGKKDKPSKEEKIQRARNAIIKDAKSYLGVKYVWGGTTPKGWDCSGFTQYVYGKNGIKRRARRVSSRNAGKVISIKDAKPGDLIWIPGHIGIISETKGQMYDAGSTRTNTAKRATSGCSAAAPRSSASSAEAQPPGSQ